MPPPPPEPGLGLSIGGRDSPIFKIFGRSAFGAAKVSLFGPFLANIGEGRKSISPPPLPGTRLGEGRPWAPALGGGETRPRDIFLNFNKSNIQTLLDFKKYDTEALGVVFVILTIFLVPQTKSYRTDNFFLIYLVIRRFSSSFMNKHFRN